MIQLKIDTIDVTVPTGTTILKAAESIGISIPTMCYHENISNHASCMVCGVRNNKTGDYIPACASKVQMGMDISSNTKEVSAFRKQALELLLSDHVGDCEAPCRVSCPAFMDIPQMNRLIAQGRFNEALKIVKEEIALPLILGYICSAPCEGACRRKQLESAVSICQLKKFVALENTDYLPVKGKNKNKRVAVIGAGIAGLAAAYHILRNGYSCVIFDKNASAGGALLQVSENELPKIILEKEIEILKNYGAEFKLNTSVSCTSIKQEYDAVIIATGADSNEADIEINKELYTTNYTNVFVCGSIITPVKMAVKVVAQGKAAALAAHTFLSGNTIHPVNKQFNSKFGKLTQTEIPEYLKESILANRTNPVQGELPGFSKEEAIAEATRCLRCDCRKSKSCKLRIHANTYEANQKKYKLDERKTIRKFFKTNVLVYEPEKCIKCGLCVELVKQTNELVGLTYIGRGFDMHIAIPFNKTLDEALEKAAIACIQACPTGALANYTGVDNQTTNKNN